MQLQVTPHLRSHKISWVKKGIEIAITEMCKVSFTIGKNYNCKIFCDVVDMDVCHLILGRPWQFDKSVWYNGRANAYIME